MTKNTRPWHSSMFVTTVMTTLNGQDPEAMSNFIYKIQTEYLDDTYETFGSSKYRSKTDDSLISDIKKAKSLLDKFDKSHLRYAEITTHSLLRLQPAARN